MSRWLAVITIVITLTVGGTGWWYWQQQTESTLEASSVSTEDRSLKKERNVKGKNEERPVNETRERSIDTSVEETSQTVPLHEIINPYSKKFSEIHEKYKKELKGYVREAEEDYVTAQKQKATAHRTIVNTYRKKADNLENRLDSLHTKQINSLEKELMKHGYDPTYVWEYEWEYETLKETNRLTFVRELISLRNFE